MDIRALCQLPSTLLHFRPREGQYGVALVCKVTYRLTPVTATLATEQEPLRSSEKVYSDNSSPSIEHPNDMVPFKPQVEMLIVGSLFPPQRRTMPEPFRPDERIVVENIPGDHLRLVTKLPGIVPRAFLDMPGDVGTSLPLRADTLWVDTDRGLCTLVFRGQMSVSSFEQPGSVVLVLQEAGETMTWADVQARLGKGDKPAQNFDPETTTELNANTFRAFRPAMPFVNQKAGTASSPRKANPVQDDEAHTAVIDIQGLRSRQKSSADPVADSGSAKDEKTRSLNIDNLLGSKPVLPFGQTSLGTMGAASSASSMTPPIAPPPLPPPSSSFPALSSGFAPPVAPAAFTPPPVTLDSPRQTPPAYVEPPPPARVIETPRAVVFGDQPGKIDPPRAFSFGDQLGKIEQPRAVSFADQPGKNMSAATYEGVVAASNAAANQQPIRASEKSAPSVTVPDKPTKTSGESIEIIWYDPSYVARMRRHNDWASLFRPPPKPQAPQRGQPPAPPPSAEQMDDATKADVYAVLSRAEPSGEHGIAPGRTGGVDHEAQLYLLAGTISFPLDEIEVLKATTRTAAPLAANDKKLKEVLDTVEEVLKMPLEGAPDVVLGFTNRVRDAWSHANRHLPSDYLVTHTERLLLNQRHYQKRELLDDEWIRCLYLGTAESLAIPTYIPAKLAKRLPLFRQFSVRMIVEALSQQDMYESHPMALRVVSLAKVLGGAESTPTKTKR